MTYTKLNNDNIVTELIEYTAEDYAVLSLVEKAELYICTNPEVSVDWVYESEDHYHSPEEEKDIQFAENSEQYIENRCDEVDELLIQRFETGYMYDGKPYKADIKSQLWANAYLQAIQNGTMSGPINWISIDNTITQFTVEGYATMCAYFLNWAQLVTFEHFQAKAAMRAATLRTDVDAQYDALYAVAFTPAPQV